VRNWIRSSAFGNSRVVSASTTDTFLRWRKSSLPWKHSLDIGLTETRPCVGYAQLLKTLRIAPHRSAGSPGACVTDCSCPQEEPKLSNLLAYRRSISHMPYGEDTDRRSRKCSSRGPGRKTSMLHRKQHQIAPSPDR